MSRGSASQLKIEDHSAAVKEQVVAVIDSGKGKVKTTPDK